MSAVGMIDWGKPQNNWGIMSDEITKAVTNRYNRAKAVEQEEKNPYVGKRELEALLMDQLKNKWYGPKMQSDIGLQGAQAKLANVNAKFTPLETYIKAENAAKTNSRFGKNFELMKALNTMDPASRSTWQAQHQEAWNEMLNDMANGEGGAGGNGSKTNQNDIAMQIMLHELQKQGGGFTTQPQQSGGNPQMPQGGGQSQMQPQPQMQQPQQSLPERLAGSPMMPGNQQQDQQQQNQVKNSVANQMLPLDEQPKSDDPDIAAAQEKLQKARFSSNASQDQQLRDQALIFATRKSNTPANNARIDGAKVLENWIAENHDPKTLAALKNVAENATGQSGQVKVWVQEKLPESMQAPWFKDYKWYNDSFIPNTKNTIKQMEKLNGDQNQRSELEKMVNMLDSPHLGSKGAIENFNRAIGSLQDMSNAIFKSGEIPQAKGLFKRVYNLPDKYNEFIPTGDKKSDMIKVKVDGKEDEIHSSQLQALEADAKKAGVTVEVVE